MRHKWYNETIAILEGRPVQWFSEHLQKWLDWSDGCGMSPLAGSIETQWRIKPEPKPDVVSYLRCGIHAAPWRFGIINRWDERFDTGDIRITRDGETGEIKAVELVK